MFHATVRSDLVVQYVCWSSDSWPYRWDLVPWSLPPLLKGWFPSQRTRLSRRYALFSEHPGLAWHQRYSGWRYDAWL